MTEWTLSSLHLEYYGRAISRSKPDATKCCESVSARDGWSSDSQCSRPRGYGPQKAYCKQHNPVAAAARRNASNERYKAHQDHRMLEFFGPRLFAALCQIADGDNNPRETAAEAIKELRKP